MLTRFIGGTNIKDLSRTLQKCKRKGWIPILDYAKEGSASKSDVISYLRSINALAGIAPTYALKLSSFAAFRPFETMDYVICHLKDYGARKIMLDAESISQEALEADVYDKLVQKHNKNGTFLYKTYQMYKKETSLEDDITRLPNLGVKLVRGAYMKRDASTRRLWDTIEQTHINYDKALAMLGRKEIPVIAATHNIKSLQLACELPKSVEVAQLLGMKDELSEQLTSDRVVYKYVPYGTMSELMPYLVRRLYENKDILKHFF